MLLRHEDVLASPAPPPPAATAPASGSAPLFLSEPPTPDAHPIMYIGGKPVYARPPAASPALPAPTAADGKGQYAGGTVEESTAMLPNFAGGKGPIVAPEALLADL